MKYKILLGVVLVMSVLFLLGCEEYTELEAQEDLAAEEQEVMEDTEEGIDAMEGDAMEDEQEDSMEIAAPQACTTNSECGDGKQCIDLVCGKLSELYESTGCEATCRFTGVTIGTNDGKSYDFVAGKGSYTAAGALQWRIESGPKHCEDEETRVPIEITKYNYGEKVNQEFVTLTQGETSRTLDHPTIKSVAFALTAKDVTVDCS